MFFLEEGIGKLGNWKIRLDGKLWFENLLYELWGQIMPDFPIP